eukprot:IDg13897t1
MDGVTKCEGGKVTYDVDVCISLLKKTHVQRQHRFRRARRHLIGPAITPHRARASAVASLTLPCVHIIHRRFRRVAKTTILMVMNKTTFTKRRRLSYLLIFALTQLALLLIFSSWPPRPPKRRPPAQLRFYASDRACAIPDACVHADKDKHEISVSDIFRTHHLRIRQCLPAAVRLRFYDKDNPPAAFHDRHDIDVVGVQVEDAYFSHLPHFTREFVAFIAVPAALFLQGRLPRPRCAEGAALVPCRSADKLRPQIVLGSEVVTKRARWVRGLAALAESKANATGRAVRVLNANPLRQPGLRCFRNVLSSSLSYNADSSRRDALLRSAGVQRRLQLRTDVGAPCAPHIVIVTRDARISMDRTVPPDVQAHLRRELEVQLSSAGMQTATVEFVAG